MRRLRSLSYVSPFEAIRFRRSRVSLETGIVVRAMGLMSSLYLLITNYKIGEPGGVGFLLPAAHRGRDREAVAVADDDRMDAARLAAEVLEGLHEAGVGRRDHRNRVDVDFCIG